MKNLQDLKNERCKKVEVYEYQGRRVIFHGETPFKSRYFEMVPTNIFGVTSSKKKAVKYLEFGC